MSGITYLSFNIFVLASNFQYILLFFVLLYLICLNMSGNFYTNFLCHIINLVQFYKSEILNLHIQEMPKIFCIFF